MAKYIEGNMRSISLDTAMAMGKQSKRTWWRRVSENVVQRTGSDSRGRTLVSMEDVLAFLSLPIEGDDIEMILSADLGNADAQNEAGQLFDEFGETNAALYWWRSAAERGSPDAMQHLGRCYLSGKGVPKDENLGIMWTAKAASLGHVIAGFQIESLRPFR